MSELHCRLSSRAERALKKIQGKRLLLKYRHALQEICEDPYRGEAKTGDLGGACTVAFRYVDGAHRIAYTVLATDDAAPLVLIVLIGNRENFFAELKRPLDTEALRNTSLLNVRGTLPNTGFHQSVHQTGATSGKDALPQRTEGSG